MQVLASLQHPNIVSCVESFVERGQLCIVMDYCAGGDLHQLVKRQRGRCVTTHSPVPTQSLTQLDASSRGCSGATGSVGHCLVLHRLPPRQPH